MVGTTSSSSSLTSRSETSVPLQPPVEVSPNCQLDRLGIALDRHPLPLKMYGGATKPKKTPHNKSEESLRAETLRIETLRIPETLRISESREKFRVPQHRLQLPQESPKTSPKIHQKSNDRRARRTLRAQSSRLESPQLLAQLNPPSPLLLLPHPSASLRKLLTSHLSIYNALTNPELDMSPNMSPNLTLSRVTPDLRDPMMTFSPWQSITNDLENPHDLLGSYGKVADDFKDLRREFKSDFSLPLVKTTSILSVTTDEEGNSSSSPKPNVMVFETDEEDDFKGTSFIMPRLYVSENIPQVPKPFLITILTSTNTDTTQFLYNIKQHLSYIDIKHLILNERNNERIHMQSSELIFVINDGSSIFVDFLTSLNSYPKLTIINLMTVNYFINLFNLINNLQPYQIWKTPSLKEAKLLDRIKNYVEIELSQIDQPEDSKDVIRKDDLDLKMLTINSLNMSRSLYSNLIPQTKSNYKDIEKQYKSDLQGSTSFSDPLKISQNFSYIRILYSVLKKSLKKDVGIEKISTNGSQFWLVCSFTMGIGLGIGIATGAASLIGFYVYQNFSLKPPLTPRVLEIKISEPKPMVDLLVDRSKDLQDYICSGCQSILDSDIASTIAAGSVVCLEGLRNIGSSVVVGFQKLVGLFTISF